MVTGPPCQNCDVLSTEYDMTLSPEIADASPTPARSHFCTPSTASSSLLAEHQPSSRSKHLSFMIRKDSFDRVVNPPRPLRPARDKVDMSVVGNFPPVPTTLRDLHDALGPLEEPEKLNTITTAGLRRVPMPVETRCEYRSPSPHLSSCTSPALVWPTGAATTSDHTNAGKRPIAGRNDLWRLQQLIGPQALAGVDTESLLEAHWALHRTSAASIHMDTRDKVSNPLGIIETPFEIPLATLPSSQTSQHTTNDAGKNAYRLTSPNSVQIFGSRKVWRTRSLPARPRDSRLFGRWFGTAMPTGTVSSSERTKISEKEKLHTRAAPETDSSELASVVLSPPRAPPPLSSIFGCSLHNLPRHAMCLAVIGGETHRLPTIVFQTVEMLFHAGLKNTELFRLRGDKARSDELGEIFSSSPLYGDDQDLHGESVHTVAALLQHYLRRLPCAVFDERLIRLFRNCCIHCSPSQDVSISAARIIIRMLPKRHLSLFVYLCAFLAQIALKGGGQLDVRSLSIVFGPAIMAPRTTSIAGLGAAIDKESSPGLVALDADGAEAIRDAQTTLEWVLGNWSAISAELISPHPAIRVEPLLQEVFAPERHPIIHELPICGLDASMLSPSRSMHAEIVSLEGVCQQGSPHRHMARMGQNTDSTQTRESTGTCSPAASSDQLSRHSSNSSQNSHLHSHSRCHLDPVDSPISLKSRGAFATGSHATQTRRLVALEAELAELRTGGTSEHRATLKKINQELDDLRLAAANESNQLTAIVQNLKDELTSRDRRIKDLEQALDSSRRECQEGGERLAQVRVAIGLL